MLRPDHFVRLALAPLLLAQGLWVGLRAQKLPEPPGPRKGGKDGGLRLLILGDSSAAGVGADHQTEALSGQLASALDSHGTVSWYLEAETGATTRTSLAKLRSLPDQEFDLALLVHGVNDTTRFATRKGYMARQAELMDRLRECHNIHHFILSGVPPMHHFPLLPQPLRWVLGCHAERLDSVLAQFGATHKDCTHVPLNLPFEPHLVAVDGFHPSPKAYSVWAGMLAKVIQVQTGRLNWRNIGTE